ncbi:uncharacterized protein EI90DRAFT_2361735 [Cantharellus anzutake]|uniref:uncharacterized protein n=1 Tax=Cantharellus anzutake TaxID=1750568 RepID=UPI001903E875|nr:uncharacterized protein EI90DRAFT_2361735 [Cantharellus anzutake]KAF8324140.1 hypothetical protein EI90DRAFT_2361735 [Cantharellus anzutake]
MDQWSNAHASSCCWDPDFNSKLYSSIDIPSNKKRPQFACFFQGPDIPGIPGVCLDPLLILDPATPPPLHRTLERCNPQRADSCEEGWSCVRPSPKEQLVRISVRPPSWIDPQTFTIVWRGPKEEVLDQIVIGKFQPRHWIVPPSIPLIVGLFQAYAFAISLSLFVLNLLPVPILDGAQIWEAIWELAGNKSPTHRNPINRDLQEEARETDRSLSRVASLPHGGRIRPTSRGGTRTA